jgi:hypothetical protein
MQQAQAAQLAQLQMATQAIENLTKVIAQTQTIAPASDKDEVQTDLTATQKPIPSILGGVLQIITFRFVADFGDTVPELLAVYENTSLVAALMLTVVSLSSVDMIGDKLDTYLATRWNTGAENALTVYTLLAFFSIGWFFVAMLLSSWMIIMLNLVGDERNSKDAIVGYLDRIGMVSRLPLVGLMGGMFTWIALQFWMMFSNIELILALFVAGAGVLMLVFLAYCQSRTVRAVYAVSVSKLKVKK